VRTTPPKTLTIYISILLSIIGIALLSVGIIEILKEFSIILDVAGLVLLALGWLILLLGVIIEGF
jgi:hypothetical protein